MHFGENVILDLASNWVYFHMRSPPEVSTPPGNSGTAAEKSSTEQAVNGPLSMSTVFTKLARRGCL